MKKTAKKSSRKSLPYCILANASYGLYCGEVVSYDPCTQVAVVKNCRHIARWYGKTGGITSLAVHGLCGPSAGDSRIGAPAESATLTQIVNMFVCSTQARTSFVEATQS